MPLNDEALKYVSTLTKIQTLTLRDLSGITDAGVLRLRTLKQIEWLSIDSPKVTSAGFKKLTANLPGPYTVY